MKTELADKSIKEAIWTGYCIFNKYNDPLMLADSRKDANLSLKQWQLNQAHNLPRVEEVHIVKIKK